MASVLLERGQNADAAAQAQRALDDAQGRGPWPLQSMILGAWASTRAGRQADAARFRDELARLAASIPINRMKRATQVLDARVALDRRDADGAIRSLNQAEAMLPPVFANFTDHPTSSVPIWFASASAYLAAGNTAEAAKRFERIVSSGAERALSPIEYVRSLYFLGQISEKQGQRDRARDYYYKFVEYWNDGDLDRQRVADARKKIAS
jgi:tetratricopeptide (TPR) repeat protein